MKDCEEYEKTRYRRGEKIFVSYIFDEGLVSKTYKELSKLN